jgi:hypothetical protein
MKALCQTIIYAACFLELSSDDTVNPDAAVKALEDISSALLSATDEEQQAFVNACQEEAHRLQSMPGYAGTAEFVRSLPFATGLKEQA